MKARRKSRILSRLASLDSEMVAQMTSFDRLSTLYITAFRVRNPNSAEIISTSIHSLLRGSLSIAAVNLFRQGEV
jgi:hypothetical protein